MRFDILVGIRRMNYVVATILIGGIFRLSFYRPSRTRLRNSDQQFTWDLDKAQIRLGVKFVGWIDEISCFSRALSIEEVKALFELEKGVTGILGSSK